MQKESEVVAEKGEGDKGSSKIKLGEVRRLMVLAKPEQKTIALAIGLVSARCCILAEATTHELVVLPAALCLVFGLPLHPLHHWTYHRSLFGQRIRSTHLGSHRRCYPRRLLCDRRRCQ